MPAAAVIPAPLAYIKVVAVKKLVVEISLALRHSLPIKGRRSFKVAFNLTVASPGRSCLVALVDVRPMFRHCIWVRSGALYRSPAIYLVELQRQVYLEKIRVLTAGSWGRKALFLLE